MRNYLLSWISEYHDFEKGEGGKHEIKYDGPSFDLHKNFYTDHDQHILLSTAPEGDELGQRLQADLSRAFEGRSIRLLALDIRDPNDFELIKARVDAVVENLKTDAQRIDLMFTTGTTTMRMVLAMTHLNSLAPTRLIQGKDPRQTGGSGEFAELDMKQDQLMGRLYVKTWRKRTEEKEFYQAKILESVYQRADRVARLDGIHSLILGSSGTGKEFLARYIHNQSIRSDKPFIAVNCASVSDELLHSELFGHKAGSYTHAIEDREGYFEAANKGSIFLDEIGDISPKMQKSLLRVIQEKEVLRLGENEPRPIDVRIIAATHQDLEKKIEEGSFREDLYFRLNEVELLLPDIVDYPERDMKGLISFFLESKAKEYGRPILKLSQDIEKFLRLYPLKGNIRELENIFTYFYVFAEEGKEIQQEDLPPRYIRKGIDRGWTMEDVLEDVKARHTQKMLDIYGGNLSRTQEALDISYNTLSKIIKRHGLRVGEEAFDT